MTRDLDGCPFTVAVLRLFETEADVFFLDDGAVEEKVPLEELEVDTNHAPLTEAQQERWCQALMELGGEDAIPMQPTLAMAATERPIEAMSADDVASNSKEGLSKEEEYEDDYEDDAEDDGDEDNDTDDCNGDRRSRTSSDDLSDVSSDEGDGPEAPKEANLHSPARSDHPRCSSASTAENTADGAEAILNVADDHQSESRNRADLSDTSSDEGDETEAPAEACVCSPVGSDQPRRRPASTSGSTAGVADGVLDVSSDEEDEQELEEILSQLSDDDEGVDDCAASESRSAQTCKQDGPDVAGMSQAEKNTSLANSDQASQGQKLTECIVCTSSPGETTADAITSGTSSEKDEDDGSGPSSNLPRNSDGEKQSVDSETDPLHSHSQSQVPSAGDIAAADQASLLPTEQTEDADVLASAAAEDSGTTLHYADAASDTRNDATGPKQTDDAIENSVPVDLLSQEDAKELDTGLCDADSASDACSDDTEDETEAAVEKDSFSVEAAGDSEASLHGADAASNTRYDSVAPKPEENPIEKSARVDLLPQEVAEDSDAEPHDADVVSDEHSDDVGPNQMEDATEKIAPTHFLTPENIEDSECGASAASNTCSDEAGPKPTEDTFKRGVPTELHPREAAEDSDAKLHNADAASDSDDASPSTRASDADVDIVDNASRCSSEKSSPSLEEDVDDTPKASRQILSPEDRALRLAYMEEAFAELPRRYEIFVHYGTHGNFDCQ